MGNPYQLFFEKLDETVEGLAGLDAVADRETMAVVDPAIDLLRRAGFVLANQLNMNAQTLPHLILPIAGEVQEVDSDPPSSD